MVESSEMERLCREGGERCNRANFGGRSTAKTKQSLLEMVREGDGWKKRIRGQNELTVNCLKKTDVECGSPRSASDFNGTSKRFAWTRVLSFSRFLPISTVHDQEGKNSSPPPTHDPSSSSPYNILRGLS